MSVKINWDVDARDTGPTVRGSNRKALAHPTSFRNPASTVSSREIENRHPMVEYGQIHFRRTAA